MDTLINMKNNLIQNFYVIGLSPEDFFYKNKDNEGEFLNIFQTKERIKLNPKIISKFPPNNSNFNEINDETIINHCFPTGLNIKYGDILSFTEDFYFELDNYILNYSPEEKNIHSKIYFTCLEIYEPINNYAKYREDIIKNLGKKIKINENKNSIDINNKNENNAFISIYVPKVLCFASILPFYKELREILEKIYFNYLESLDDKYNNNSSDLFILEKLIEQIVLKIPIPLNHEEKIQISFDSNKFKEKIIFPKYKIEEENIKLYFTNSIINIFYYFSAEDILRIIKYILLEIPILFFYPQKNILTSILEGFISFISPFKYVQPYISILPKKSYGFISIEKKFIFGINEKYNKNFFIKNGIEIDKNIVIIYIDKNAGKIEIINKEDYNNNDLLIIEEDDNINISEKNLSDNSNNYVDNDYIIYNGIKIELINIELPNNCKKKLCDDLENYINKLKKGVKNNSFIIKESIEFDYKIRKYFYKFFIDILSGYTDYYLNSKYFYEAYTTKNCGYELLFKNNDINFMKEIFNYDEFVNKSDSPIFYFMFCQTKLFINFLRERIYLNDKTNSMKYRQFDQICFFKKHKEQRKKKENKIIYEEYKKIDLDKLNNKDNKNKIKEIIITKENFNEIEKNIIKNKYKDEILIKYGQNIYQENNIKYNIFPKLFFDDEFFDTKYENLFLSHEIEMPSSKTIDNYTKLCSLYSADYYKKRRIIFPPASLENIPSTNNSKINFGINSYFYIFYDWIILLCCSLWYCDPIERIVRLDEIIIILDKLYYIEEIVAKLIFESFIKYGNKMQCIEVYEKLIKFYGYSNYLYLNLLNNKLCHEEEILYNKYLKYNINNNSSNNEYIFKSRSLILSLENFIQKKIGESNLLTEDKNKIFRNTMFNIGIKNSKMSILKSNNKNNNNKDINYKEKIIFSSEQYCNKCKCYNSFDFEEIKKQKLSKINYTYKCIKCKSYKNDLYIKYQILLFNIKRNELFLTKMSEFKLLPPNRLYKELMYNLTSQKNWEINIDNIIKQNQINLMNYIFYFSIEGLSFDFLLPKKKLNDENFELIQNNLCSVICDINKDRFSILNNVESNDIINKSLKENIENDNFIPIDISNTDNFERYFDLIPSIINEKKNNDFIIGNNNNNTNIEANNEYDIFDEYKSDNYFTINREKIK